MAFDRNAMVRAILFGEGVASAGLIPPSLEYAYGGATRPLTTYNAERAKAELAKSKYKAGQEGVVLTWGQTWWRRIAEVFTAQANQTLGTKLTVEVTEANTVFQRLRSGDYQASALGLARLHRPRRIHLRHPAHEGLAQLPRLLQPEARYDARAGPARARQDQARRHLQGGRDARCWRTCRFCRASARTSTT